MMEDLSIDELADQEWDVGDDKSTRFEYQFLNGHTMVFECQDPDVDDLLEFFAPGDDDQSRDKEMFDLVSSAVIEPRVTLQKWRDLKPVDRIGLFEEVAGAIGVTELLGFTGSGADLELDDLPSA